MALPPSKPDYMNRSIDPFLRTQERKEMTKERLDEELTRRGFTPTRYSNETIYSLPFAVEDWQANYALQVHVEDDGKVEIEYSDKYESANLPLVPFVWEVLDLVRAYQEGVRG